MLVIEGICNCLQIVKKKQRGVLLSDGHEDMQRHVRYGHVPHTVYTLKIKKIKNNEISMMMKMIKRSIKKINK